MNLLYSLRNVITVFILISVTYISTKAQNTLSESEKRLIAQQVKTEILDSMRNMDKTSLGQISDALSVMGYLETYYSYDFGNPDNHNRPGFMYSHNRHNEINVNLGFIKTAYQTDKIRANLAVAVGTYMNANYSAEPTVMKNIYEAYVGIKLSKRQDVWIDAGIMPSHIGFESAVGKDNWTLTRGLYAENSPYFNTGAKISFSSPNGKWLLSGLILNGWQRIQRIDGNNIPALGHQITYKPNSNITLNSSSFVGSDKPDSIRQMRYFHNLYGIFQVNERLGLTAGLDIGAQQISKGSSNYNTWFTPVIVVKYSLSERLSVSARGEYFSDVAGVIIAAETTNNFQTLGYSLNLDYQIHNNVLWRIEGRGLTSKDKLFVLNDTPSNNNYFITTALSISF